MGLFSKSVDQKAYLKNLLADMRRNASEIRPGCLPTDRQKATELLGAFIATVVSLRVIAEYIFQADPTDYADKQLETADRILEDVRLKAWALADIYGLDMREVLASGREDSQRYLQWIGGDATFQHEWNMAGHKEFRIDAVLSVAPELEGEAIDAMFWGIINAQ